ncbi:hypothetical protein BGZ79_009264, partial [Entomortierella chlamydospora]
TDQTEVFVLPILRPEDDHYHPQDSSLPSQHRDINEANQTDQTHVFKTPTLKRENNFYFPQIQYGNGNVQEDVQEDLSSSESNGQWNKENVPPGNASNPLIQPFSIGNKSSVADRVMSVLSSVEEASKEALKKSPSLRGAHASITADNLRGFLILDMTSLNYTMEH